MSNNYTDDARIDAEVTRRSERELERIRGIQKRIRDDAARRRQQAVTADERQRAEEQPKLKSEVETYYLHANPSFTRADFEAAWKENKERLVLEMNQFYAGVPRL